MKKLLLLALAFISVSHADTITFRVEGYQNSIDVWFEGTGQIGVPNGTVTAGLSDVNQFSFKLYDIESSQNINFAYDNYQFGLSDLTEFAGTFDSIGEPTDLVFRTDVLDPNNDASELIVNWTPTSIQPTADVGGIGVDFWPTSQVIPEPVSLAMCGLGLIAWGLRRKCQINGK
jgi:hypothetical protein